MKARSNKMQQKDKNLKMYPKERFECFLVNKIRFKFVELGF